MPFAAVTLASGRLGAALGRAAAGSVGHGARPVATFRHSRGGHVRVS